MPHSRYVPCPGQEQVLPCGCIECPECDTFVRNLNCNRPGGHTFKIEVS